MLHSDRRAPWILTLGWMLCACANTPATSPPGGFELVLHPSLQQQPAAYHAAWTLYGLTRGKTYEDLQDVRRNPAADDYLIELRARSALAEFWRAQREQDAASTDDYLDRLVAIDDAGQLEEYVLATFGKPGWTIPAAEFARLDLTTLEKRGLQPTDDPTYALAMPRSGTLWPDAPGTSLPDPEALAPDRIPCSRSLPTLRGAMAAWEAEQDRLDGAPAAADDRTTFFHLLVASASGSPDTYGIRGATWVSTRAYWLSFLAGFCAVDQGDFASAERWLENAVAMSPHTAAARMELAHALIAQRKLDRADAIIETALATSQDRCELARAWRRRGYIRFEQGRFEDARSAYQRSLEHDPDSRIARSELELLRIEIAKHGGIPDSSYEPPPTGQTVTACPES